MRISFITTVFNEENTIEVFLDSLFAQSKLPDEIIIVDGKSHDSTLEKIKKYELISKKNNIPFKILIKKGNRSVGRNEAINHATGEIIACSDSGNILDKNWLRSIVKPFENKNVDVVGGYYEGLAKTIFQKCLTPFVLVMPDKIEPENFLPATRSIAFKKSTWKMVGGFPEEYSHNEDYVFANKLKEKKAKIEFANDAIVYWLPRKSFKQAFTMFFRFALGDGESGIWRTTVLLLFARYILGLYLLFLVILYKSSIGLFILLIFLVLYLLWSISKNYKYVKLKQAVVLLPLLQFTADAAVLSGTIIGVLKRIKEFNYFLYIKQNKFLFFISLVYISVMLFILRWGIPNQYHPFPYQMDEWHQLEAVANTFRYGTPNTSGSANGTMFQFILSGFYLVPFMLLKIVNPFALHIDNPFMRERIFEVLRLQTILLGVLCIFILYKISESITVSKKLVITLFVFTPLWFALSNFFKYDIALLFWTLLSLLCIFRFSNQPNTRNFILAGIPSALTLAVKVSAMPMFLIYVLSYFWFYPAWKKHVRVLLAGSILFIAIIILFGAPDTLFGRGNIVSYFYENVIHAPATSSNYNLGMPPLLYVFSIHYPMIFGHGFIFLFLSLVVFGLVVLGKKGEKDYKKLKQISFLTFCFLIFLFSLIPLQMFGGANRALVLLPFFVLLMTFLFDKIAKIAKVKLLAIIIVSLVIFLQVLESAALLQIKIMKSPPEQASLWLIQHVPKGRTIGIENIPLYQDAADVIVKEFYYDQYKVGIENRFTYKIIDVHTKILPSIVVLSNDELEKQFIKYSEKNKLTDRLVKEKYKKIAVFYPDLSGYVVFNKIQDYYLYAWIIGAPYNVSVYVK